MKPGYVNGTAHKHDEKKCIEGPDCPCFCDYCFYVENKMPQ